MTTVARAGAAESSTAVGDPAGARRFATRAFRTTRAWPAFLAGLVLLVAGVAVAVETMSIVVGRPLGLIPFERVTALASGTGWNHPAVVAVSCALVLLGLVLLAEALVPGRGGHLPLRTDDPALAVGLTRAGMRSALVAAVRQVDGVDAARVTVGRRRVRVRVRTHLRTENGMSEAVDGAVRERIAELAPLRPLRVRTRVTLAKA